MRSPRLAATSARPHPRIHRGGLVLVVGLTFGALVWVPWGAALAQLPRAEARPPALSAAVVFAGLGVTTAQRGALVAITERGRAERAALMTGKTAGARLTRAEVAALERSAAAQRAAIHGVLTTEQGARLMANVAAARAEQDAAWRAQADSARHAATDSTGATRGSQP